MADQPIPGRPAAVLLDALGTLVHLEPPGPRLRIALRERAGLAVSEAAAADAIRAEIVHYRAHMARGSDAQGLAELRAECAEVVRTALGPPAAEVPSEAMLAALLDAIHFTAYPDSAPVLRELRAAGLRLVVASNWDVSLHEALEKTGLAPLLDGAVASAELGSAKPDRVIFDHALALAGVGTEAALHVGDSPWADVAGARAAGLRAVLVHREGPVPEGVQAPVIRSLSELPALLAYPPD